MLLECNSRAYWKLLAFVLNKEVIFKGNNEIQRDGGSYGVKLKKKQNNSTFACVRLFLNFPFLVCVRVRQEEFICLAQRKI